MSNKIDLPFHLGEDWKLNISAKDGNGDAIDLDGATIQFRVASSSAALITATNGSGITITSNTLGTFTVQITPTMQTTGTIAAGASYRWECRITTAATLKTVQARGIINVQPSLFIEFA